MIDNQLKNLFTFRQESEKNLPDDIQRIYELTNAITSFFDDPEAYKDLLNKKLEVCQSLDLGIYHLIESIEYWEVRYYLLIQLSFIINNDKGVKIWAQDVEYRKIIAALQKWKTRLMSLSLQNGLAKINKDSWQAITKKLSTHVFMLSYIQTCHLLNYYAPKETYQLVLADISYSSPFIITAFSSYITEEKKVAELLDLENYTKRSFACLELLGNYAYWVENIR